MAPYHFDRLTRSLILKKGVKSMEFEIRAPRVFVSKKGEGAGENLKILRCSNA
jgi:hypothetical protein